MSDSDFGSRDIRIDTSFSRSANSTRDFLATESLPRDRYSRASHVSRLRDVTWISASQPSQFPANQTPQTSSWQHSTPAQRPPPALHKTQPTLSDSDEYMTVDIESGIEEEKGYGFNEDRKHRGERRFYGGFINRLRSIPRVMSRGRFKSKENVRPGKQGTPITLHQSNPQSPATSFSQRRSLPNDVPQVERIGTPSSLVLTTAKPNTTLDADTRASVADTRRDRTLSAVNETYESSHSHNHDGAVRARTRGHRSDTSSTSRPFSNFTEADFVHHPFHPSMPATPVFVEPPPAADFAKMESPIRPRPEEPIASQVARIRRFMRNLNRLPWCAPARISSEYFPGQSERRRYSRQRYPKKTSKSWYAQRSKGMLDLLAGPSTPSTTARLPQHVQNAHPVPVPAPFVMSPSSANFMFPGQFPGPRRSRSRSTEGAPSSSDNAGNAPSPYMGPIYPAYVAQPLFVYPTGLPPAGSGGSPEQPRPVFFTCPVAPQFGSPERPRSPRLPSQVQHGGSRMPVLA